MLRMMTVWRKRSDIGDEGSPSRRVRVRNMWSQCQAMMTLRNIGSHRDNPVQFDFCSHFDAYAVLDIGSHHDDPAEFDIGS